MRAALRSTRVARGLAATVCTLLALAIASCGDDDPYDTSCGADAECVVVPIGRDCGGCLGSCRRTTINSGDLARYNEDRKDSDIDCSDQGEICSGQPCTEPSAFCANGNCSLR